MPQGEIKKTLIVPRDAGISKFGRTVVFLAQDDAGYLNLKQLVSRSYQEGQHLGRAMIDPAWLHAESTRGLIALSGGSHGDVGRALVAGHPELAADKLDHWLSLFGDRYYLQLVRTGREHEEKCVHASVDPVVMETRIAGPPLTHRQGPIFRSIPLRRDRWCRDPGCHPRHRCQPRRTRAFRGRRRSGRRQCFLDRHRELD